MIGTEKGIEIGITIEKGNQDSKIQEDPSLNISIKKSEEMREFQITKRTKCKLFINRQFLKPILIFSG